MRILYVDDDADLREIAGMALGLDPGLEVKLCDGGAAAIATARMWGPDLILLDVMMPEMDGPTTFTALRGDPLTANVPIAFITARSQGRDVERLTALGAVGIISKPFDAMTLAAQARAFLTGG